jgi:hypothetical protein
MSLYLKKSINRESTERHQSITMGGSTQSRKEQVRPRAEKDRVHQHLGQYKLYVQSRITLDCGSVRTTELSIMLRGTTDILSHKSLRCSTGPQVCLSAHSNHGKQPERNRATIPIRGHNPSAVKRQFKESLRYKRCCNDGK